MFPKTAKAVRANVAREQRALAAEAQANAAEAREAELCECIQLLIEVGGDEFIEVSARAMNAVRTSVKARRKPR